MLKLIRPDNHLIRPYNLYTAEQSARKRFLDCVCKQDTHSLEILDYLIRYCCQHNGGKWCTITNTVRESMEKDASKKLQFNESYVVTQGLLIEEGPNLYLTHDFIMESFLIFTDGNFIPLSKYHINFEKKEAIENILRDKIGIAEPQAVTFLSRLAYEFEKSTTRGELVVSLPRSFEIAYEEKVIVDLGIQWGESRGILAGDIENDRLICNALMWILYWAAPSNLN